MTSLQSRTHHHSLLAATEQLVRERLDLNAGQVIAAVARAKRHAWDLYATNKQNAPVPEDYVALVIGMAKQELAGDAGLSDSMARERVNVPSTSVATRPTSGGAAERPSPRR